MHAFPPRAADGASATRFIEEGNGIHPAHLLATECVLTLRKQLPGRQPTVDGPIGDSVRATGSPDSAEIRNVDLPKLEADAATQQRRFLQIWRGRVPSDLVIVYLGLIGRDSSVRALAEEWSAEATATVGTLWADLDDHFPKTILYPNSLPTEVDRRRYVIKLVGETVRAQALSGDLFDAPLDDSDDGTLIGNLHRTHQGIRDADGTVRDLIALPLRSVDLDDIDQQEACRMFRRLVETIATDCLWLQMNDQRAALEKILDKAETVDQVTLLETKHLLRDRLPAVLSELKLPTTDHAQEALRDYQDKESHLHRLSAPVHKIDALKSDLWRAVSVPQTASELLSAVRARIGEYGYSSARVLFELFQNADDAYRQQEFPVEDACFRVEVTQECAGGFRVIHWGRPVNHLGHDPEHGRRRGYGRDLLNMLLMNFSEKRPGDDLTGKFGLGFKSVHVLSDTVGIASGFITLRTAGGFLPKSWPRGMNLVERHRSQHGRKATVIDVPFSDETAGDGRKAIDAFRAAMSWLPACSRTIRRIHLFDGDPLTVECTTSDLLGQTGIQVVSISGGYRRCALRFDLEEGFRLLVAIRSCWTRRFSV